jgi:hypothetical protein
LQSFERQANEMQSGQPSIGDRRYVGSRDAMRRMDREQKNRAGHINIPPDRQVSEMG